MNALLDDCAAYYFCHTVDPDSKKMQDVGRPPSPNPCLLANGKLLEAGYLIKERQRILVWYAHWPRLKGSCIPSLNLLHLNLLENMGSLAHCKVRSVNNIVNSMLPAKAKNSTSEARSVPIFTKNRQSRHPYVLEHRSFAGNNQII